MSGSTSSIEIRDGDSRIVLRKVYTRAGERLEVRAPRLATVVRLDAMALEGLSWADYGTIRDLTESSFPSTEFDPAGGNDVAGDVDGDPIRITNEFGLAVVREIGSAWVEVRSPKIGYSNRLEVRTLEAITREDGAFFSGLLATPFGPSGHAH